MNRLRGARAYLCGAMSYQPEDEWRSMMTQFLNGLGVKVLDPRNKPIDIGVEDSELQQKLLREERYGEFAAMMKSIRCVDLRMVDISDFLVVHLDRRVYTVGTWEEIFLANREKKPILVHIEQGKNQAMPWLFGTIPHQMIFSDWDGLKAELLRVNESEESVLYRRRWYLFDFERLTTAGVFEINGEWVARININGSSVPIGTFASRDEAVEAYNELAAAIGVKELL